MVDKGIRNNVYHWANIKLRDDFSSPNSWNRLCPLYLTTNMPVKHTTEVPYSSKKSGRVGRLHR